MNEESSLRRFKAGSPGKQSHSENSAKELTYAKNNYNSPEFDRETGNHIENMKNGGNNILVAIRVRPMNQKEFSISNYEIVKILDSKVVVLLDPQNEFEREDVLRNNRNRDKQFAFDFAFDKETSTETVFNYATEFLIKGIVTGYNATVFAYGATGAGKTYTMMGQGDSSGLMGLTLNELFEEINETKSEKEFIVKVSYLEVYNETIRDLLSSEDTNLDLREDPVRGNCIVGITEIITTSTSEIMAILKIGNKNRTMEATGANQVSSRSHAVLQVVVENKDKNQGMNEEMTVGKLSLVDLAGSERAANTNNRGIRMIEGANINKSLLALGNCINMLSEQSNEKSGRTNFIPYRDSKLTRLLKDSLGGNCRTVMIANISPAASSFEDTHNTLKYANRAKNIKTNASRNVLEVSNHVSKYTQIISNLRNENEQLRRQVHDQSIESYEPSKMPIDHNGGIQPLGDKLRNQIQEHFDQEMAVKKKIYDMEDQLDSVGHQIFGSLMDLKKNDDKTSRERVDSFKQAQKDMTSKLEALQIEYNGIYSKRNGLLQAINNERKENLNYLMGVFKQLQFNMENMDFQHREKQSENQLKSKDLQIIYLQNQVLARDEALKDQKSLLENNKIKNAVNYSKIKSIQDIEDEVRIALPQYKGTTSPSLKKNNTPGRVRQGEDGSSLPAIARSQPINTKIQASNRSSPKKGYVRGGLNKSIDSGSYATNNKTRLALNLGQTPGNASLNKYYFNKEAMYRYRYDDKPVISVRPKRKVGYLPPIELNINSINDHQPERGKMNRGANSQRRAPGTLNRSLELSPRHRSSTLSDRSYVSTASSNSQKTKQRVLAEKNRQRQVLPEVFKERALRLHAHIPSRYNESPYVVKFQNQKDRAGNRSIEGNLDNSVTTRNLNEGKIKNTTPKLQNMKKIQKLNRSNENR